MEKPTMAVVGIGATGAVLAAALLSRDPEVILVDPSPVWGNRFDEMVSRYRVSSTIRSRYEISLPGSAT